MDEQESRADFLQRLRPSGIPLQGDGYVRYIRALQGLLRLDPQQIEIPNLDVDPRVGLQVAILDASGPPFRRTGQLFRGAWQASAVAAQFSGVSLFNIPPAQAGLGVLSVMLVDDIEVFNAAAGYSIGIMGGDTPYGNTTAIPMNVEEPSVQGVNAGIVGGFGQAVRGVDAGRCRVGVGASSTFLGAPGFYTNPPGVTLTHQDVVPLPWAVPIFPGEALVIAGQTVNIALWASVAYRRFDFGALALAG